MESMFTLALYGVASKLLSCGTIDVLPGPCPAQLRSKNADWHVAAWNASDTFALYATVLCGSVQQAYFLGQHFEKARKLGWTAAVGLLLFFALYLQLLAKFYSTVYVAEAANLLPLPWGPLRVFMPVFGAVMISTLVVPRIMAAVSPTCRRNCRPSVATANTRISAV